MVNPYDDALRKAQLAQLGSKPMPSKVTTAPTPASGAPTSNTMPIDFPPRTVSPFPDATAAPDAGKPTGPSGNPYTGFTPKYAFEGFNFDREQNPGKSAKDAFAMLANQAPPPPLNDKAALGQWFEQFIRPGMDALGHHVTGVNGDSFTYGNDEGNFTVDYGRGAGAENGALAWQAEGADDATRQRYGNSAPSTSSGANPRSAMNLLDPSSPVSNDVLAQIMAELQAIVNGGQSPARRSATLGLLE